MITLRPFKALRPTREAAPDVAAPPYDVIDTATAREIGKNSRSLVHITRSEIHFAKDQDPYSHEVYRSARENLDEFQKKGILFEEDRKSYYIYRQIMDGRAQSGIVGCASIDDYRDGKIKKHEVTRVDKEADRINHFYTCEADTEPVFLFCRKNDELKHFIERYTGAHAPEYDLVTNDGVTQMLWVVGGEEEQKEIEAIFAALDELYIADGHHRTASAYNVGMVKRKENPNYTGDENFNYVMSVVFPADELLIMPYNRLVKDMNDLMKDEFVARVTEKFDIEKITLKGDERSDYTLKLKKIEPKRRGEFTMIMEEEYYRLTPKKGTFDEADVVASLDVSILQENLLGPVLGIDDPRTNRRIEFFGGVDMLEEIEAKLLVRYRRGLGFLLYPTQIEDIMKISDSNFVMPPKSTWFEPKLKSGLFMYKF